KGQERVSGNRRASSAPVRSGTEGVIGVLLPGRGRWGVPSPAGCRGGAGSGGRGGQAPPLGALPGADEGGVAAVPGEQLGRGAGLRDPPALQEDDLVG